VFAGKAQIAKKKCTGHDTMKIDCCQHIGSALW
jgi:hypothetical protein